MRAALDTNILAYAAGVNDDRRRDEANTVLRSIPSGRLVIPAQALGELYVVLVREGRPRADAREAILDLRDIYTVIETSERTLTQAIDLATDHRISLWDAVIMAAASEAGCRLLLSKDMHHGFPWGGVAVVNPFAAAPHPLLTILQHG